MLETVNNRWVVDAHHVNFWNGFFFMFVCGLHVGYLCVLLGYIGHLFESQQMSSSFLSHTCTAVYACMMTGTSVWPVSLSTR